MTRPQLIDVVAAAQTVESHEAVVEVVKFHLKEDDELAERYLTTVSLSTRPSEFLLKGNIRVISIYNRILNYELNLNSRPINFNK